MPRGDKTGPMGTGPMTGRGAGYCAGYDVPGCANDGVGMGGGRGRGMGRRGMGGGMGQRGAQGGGFGRRNRFMAPDFPGAAVNPVSEREAMQSQIDNLEAQLAAIRNRLSGADEE